MSYSLHHPFSLFTISSLLLLFILVSSAAGYSPSDISKTTTARARTRGRNNKQSVDFLHAHNVARAASGASSLKWDQSLARFASNWCKQRKADCKMTHSSGPYGENIFWYQRSEHWSPQRVVTKWMQESLNYNPITNTCAPGKMCGHYTQIIWRKTSSVGCARTRCDNNLGFLVVCEYSPSGNYEGESPFDLAR